MQKNYSNIPTWIIVLTIIFAWPIGLILIVLKYLKREDSQYNSVNNSNTKLDNANEKLKRLEKRRKKYKIFIIIQFVLAIIFFCSMISDIITQAENLTGGIYLNIIAFAVLISLCITYFKTNRLIKKIETYQNLILIRDIYDTQKLASYIGCSRKEVLDFVSYMIREKYLNLDIENDNLAKPKVYVDPAAVFSIVCQSCGATNQYIKGKSNKCEYCGNILNLNKI